MGRRFAWLCLFVLVSLLKRTANEMYDYGLEGQHWEAHMPLLEDQECFHPESDLVGYELNEFRDKYTRSNVDSLTPPDVEESFVANEENEFVESTPGQEEQEPMDVKSFDTRLKQENDLNAAPVDQQFKDGNEDEDEKDNNSKNNVGGGETMERANNNDIDTEIERENDDGFENNFSMINAIDQKYNRPEPNFDMKPDEEEEDDDSSRPSSDSQLKLNDYQKPPPLGLNQSQLRDSKEIDDTTVESDNYMNYKPEIRDSKDMDDNSNDSTKHNDEINVIESFTSKDDKTKVFPLRPSKFTATNNNKYSYNFDSKATSNTLPYQRDRFNFKPQYNYNKPRFMQPLQALQPRRPYEFKASVPQSFRNFAPYVYKPAGASTPQRWPELEDKKSNVQISKSSYLRPFDNCKQFNTKTYRAPTLATDLQESSLKVRVDSGKDMTIYQHPSSHYSPHLTRPELTQSSGYKLFIPPYNKYNGVLSQSQHFPWRAHPHRRLLRKEMEKFENTYGIKHKKYFPRRHIKSKRKSETLPQPPAPLHSDKPTAPPLAFEKTQKRPLPAEDPRHFDVAWLSPKAKAANISDFHSPSESKLLANSTLISTPISLTPISTSSSKVNATPLTSVDHFCDKDLVKRHKDLVSDIFDQEFNKILQQSPKNSLRTSSLDYDINLSRDLPEYPLLDSDSENISVPKDFDIHEAIKRLMEM